MPPCSSAIIRSNTSRSNGTRRRNAELPAPNLLSRKSCQRQMFSIDLNAHRGLAPTASPISLSMLVMIWRNQFHSQTLEVFRNSLLVGVCSAHGACTKPVD
jgi:hypothetical protein